MGWGWKGGVGLEGWCGVGWGWKGGVGGVGLEGVVGWGRVESVVWMGWGWV